MTKLNSKQLRVSQPSEEQIKNIKRNPIYFVLDEIIDTYNIGSLFRLADAAAIEKMYLCGKMEYPPNSRIHKAAVGTENWVPWEKTDSILETIKMLKKNNVQIIATEQSENSISYKDLKPNFPAAIIIGNETYGISKEILKEADIVVEFPMFGINRSFNTWGSAAIITYKIIEELT
jgi:23S rRNA (guanosine2251-2'-O)-methyltransferase